MTEEASSPIERPWIAVHAVVVVFVLVGQTRFSPCVASLYGSGFRAKLCPVQNQQKLYPDYDRTIIMSETHVVYLLTIPESVNVRTDTLASSGHPKRRFAIQPLQVSETN